MDTRNSDVVHCLVDEGSDVSTCIIEIFWFKGTIFVGMLFLAPSVTRLDASGNQIQISLGEKSSALTTESQLFLKRHVDHLMEKRPLKCWNICLYFIKMFAISAIICAYCIEMSECV